MNAHELMDQDPAAFQGDPPPFAVYAGHRTTWVLEAFDVMREAGLVGHVNALAWMNLLNRGCWDVCGADDGALYAWHRVYVEWASVVAAQNAAASAAKRGDKHAG
jgi:hypothetical protein